MKAMIAALATAIVLVSAAWAGSAQTNKTTFVPACPHPTYAPDGNFAPLFCVIDNPLALRNFASAGRRTFALGGTRHPDKSPQHSSRTTNTQRSRSYARHTDSQLGGIIGASACRLWPR